MEAGSGRSFHANNGGEELKASHVRHQMNLYIFR